VPRAHRHYTPGSVWHITHRCHNRAFLLKFERDRKRWKHLLFQARQRYGLSVLNYIATSNHVHLLVRDTGPGVISRSVQWAAGRLAQEFNRRKSRKGAFWEDRYFATAVSTDDHLLQCLVYIDLNMVRARVVVHPAQWNVAGYNDIQDPPARYRIIDYDALCALAGFSDFASFRQQHRFWIDQQLASGKLVREPKWSESVAVGRDL